ncbi:MAG: ATP-dependent DNA helicase RecG [bacterium]
MIQFNTPVQSLARVGLKIASALNRLEIFTAADLLNHFPFRYDDFTKIVPIARLKSETVATVQGKIELIGSRRSFRKRMVVTEAAIRDDTGYLKIVWFNQPYLKKILKPGDDIMVSGKVSLQYGSPQMLSPSYEKIQAEQTHVGRIVPVYGVTEGITPKYFRSLIKQVLPLANKISEPLPGAIIKQEKLLFQSRAISAIHFPKTSQELDKAQYRLAFNELLRLQLESRQTKNLLKTSPASQITFQKEKTKKFVDQLPFQLTKAQKKSAWEIIKDLGSLHPMNRLLQGDVGSGKTVVAVLAMLNAHWNNFQAVFMAPTEILAEQHFQTITKLLGQNINLGLLTGSQSKTSQQPVISKQDLKDQLKQGKLPIVFGTHALIEQDVEFKSLGLVIIDEQHRFGVNQRQTLKDKSSKQNQAMPHFLSMTATPIPRTLALTLYSDLDISTIDELPKNRLPIITKLVPPDKRNETYGFIRKQIDKGFQIFIITALIDESDSLGIKAATKEHVRLSEQIFPDLNIGLLHGRLPGKTKEQIMRDFADNKFNILVSTAVVEVGVDIPNATVMVIEDAERFGLAQLHQFRGRVGRSKAQSYCFLFTESTGKNARLDTMTKITDGFAIAEADLKLRGPGELRRGKQSGLPDFAMSSLHDIELIKKTRDIARQILEQDPELTNSPLLKHSLSDTSIHWE